MTNEKTQCGKCNAKFLILGRDKITCTHCNNVIVIHHVTPPIPTPEIKKEEVEEAEEELIADEDLDIPLKDDFQE
jgi:DNA-directed RNA polymerase subunit RPC12/RpoP